MRIEYAYSTSERVYQPSGALPAAGAPLGNRRWFCAERRVLAVAGIEPGFVGEAVEQLVLDVVDERGEVLGVAASIATPREA
jgi:hypothetical protein